MMSVQIISRTRCMFFINVMLNNFGTVECKLQTFESYKKKKQQQRNWIENLYFNEDTFKFPLLIKHSICAAARTPNNDYRLWHSIELENVASWKQTIYECINTTNMHKTSHIRRINVIWSKWLKFTACCEYIIIKQLSHFCIALFYVWLFFSLSLPLSLVFYFFLSLFHFILKYWLTQLQHSWYL